MPASRRNHDLGKPIRTMSNVVANGFVVLSEPSLEIACLLLHYSASIMKYIMSPCNFDEHKLPFFGSNRNSLTPITYVKADTTKLHERGIEPTHDDLCLRSELKVI